MDIPAYHRLYDLTATEEVDSTNTFTGNNILRWTVRNPSAADLVENDLFEVQRALTSDFSDAETIGLEPLVQGDNYGTYTVIDDSRTTWTGNAEATTDTIDRHVSTSINGYELTDAEGNLIALLDLKLAANNLVSPGVPVYYRVRRASSSIWGWGHEFAQTAKVTKHNFLAPLAEIQPAYTLDPEYAENRKVNFSIKIDNKQVSYDTPSLDNCSFTYEIKEGYSDDIDLDIEVSSYQSSTLRSEVYCTLYDRDGEVIKSEWQVTGTQRVNAKKEGILSIRYQHASRWATWQNKSYTLNASSQLTIKENWKWEPVWGDSYLVEFSMDEKGGTSEETKNLIAQRMQTLEPTLKSTLLSQLSTEISTSLGRSMWDRTARLVLVRSLEENPDAKTEFIIPQDNIVRQADGSWVATFSDVADKGCTHYTYAVRIDQSSADLHVQDSTELLPKVLTGPSLYFDEAATITSFEVSQGVTDSNLKRGVMLSWTPS